MPIFWNNWQQGYAAYFLDPDTTNAYYVANGIDASLRSQMTLAPGFASTGLASGSLAENIVYWPQFKTVQFAVGSQNVYCWQPTASPVGWQVALAVGSTAGPIGQPEVFSAIASAGAAPTGQFLYIPTGSAYWVGSTGSTWQRVATQAAHFVANDNHLWKAYSDVNGVWQIAQSSDGINFGAANTFQVASGVATVTGLLAYDNRVYIFSTAGIQTIDNSGNIDDLVPELSRYGDQNVGKGADTYHGVAYIPSTQGLLQFYGSNIVNPQVSQALRSIGPDQATWNQSNVRGHPVAVAPHVNFLYSTMNSEAGNGFLLKYSDTAAQNYPPGWGWHPLMQFLNQGVGAPHVSNLPWYGTAYPILWTSAGSGNFAIYQARLPYDGDNPLTDTNCSYQALGTLDLPLIDDNLPNLPKMWEKFVGQVVTSSQTSIQMFAAIDSSTFSPVGGVVTATVGIVEWDFSSVGTQGFTMRPRIQMATTSPTQTPVLNSLNMDHLIRPLRRRYWTMTLQAQDNLMPNDNTTAAQKIANLDVARQLVAPVVLYDLLGQYAIVTVQNFSYSSSDRLEGKGPQFDAQVQLQDLGNLYYTQSAYTMISLTS